MLYLRSLVLSHGLYKMNSNLISTKSLSVSLFNNEIWAVHSRDSVKDSSLQGQKHLFFFYGLDSKWKEFVSPRKSTKVICEDPASLKYFWKVTKKEETSKLTVRGLSSTVRKWPQSRIAITSILWKRALRILTPPKVYIPSKTESNSFSSPQPPHYQFIFTIHSSSTKGISSL